MNKIAELKQMPIIDFSEMEKVGKNVDERLSVYNFDNLLIDEESVKGYKKLRAELNKELKVAEDLRKEIKKSINAPYKEFESSYDFNVKTKYEQSINKLKIAIDEVEDKIKQEKINELKEYFDNVNDFDFIYFDTIIKNVGLSDSLKQHKDTIDIFLEKIKNDMKLIELQENKERVTVVYKKTLDVSQSIIDVKESIEQEKSLKEIIDLKVTKDIVEEEKQNFMLFVNCTEAELSDLKSFMIKNNISYEI